MKKETIESIIKWSITPILLVILIIVVHNSKEKNQIEEKSDRTKGNGRTI